MKLIRKELKIYRGTYAEIMEAETIDMAIYFAWDTREIFVGNALGVKVPYNGGESLTANQVKLLIDEQLTTAGIAAEVSDIKRLLTLNNVNYANVTSIAQEALNTVNTFDSTLMTLVNDEINSVLATWESTTLGDLYFNKEETSTLVSTSVSSLRDNVYSKIEIDSMGLNDIASNTEFQQYKEDILKYFSVETIITQQTDNIGSLALTDGLYRINFSTVGLSFVIVSGIEVSRITPSGKVEIYNSEADTWSIYLDTNDVVSINNITPINNNITLTTDDIDGTTLRPWNNILAQNGEAYVGAVNPLGRHAQYDIGDYSIAFGYNVRAIGDNSIAIGNQSEANAVGSIQLGQGNNTVANSLNVWDYQLVRSDGKIPQERIIERFFEYQLTIQPQNWVSNSYSANIADMTADALVWVSPDASSFDDYGKNGIRAVSQALNTLIFVCIETPVTPITINIVWRV